MQDTRFNSRALLGIALRRGGQAGAVALLVGTLSFFMMRWLPGDFAYRIAAGRYGYDLVSAEAAEAVRRELGLDAPWYTALADWWLQLLRFDLGESLVTGHRIIDEVAHQLGHTLSLAFAAIALSVVIALPLGIAAGLRPRGWADRLGEGAAIALRAFPPFLLGLLLVIAAANLSDAIPAAGHGEAGNLLLPALTLALGLAAASSRVARESVARVVASDYYAFALTKGLSPRLALWRHGVRNAALPVIAYLGVQLAFVIEGVVILETLFAWPGIGHALVHAVFWRDVPMIQGTCLMLGLCFVLLNAAVDLACLLLDPRRRRGT
ncbi:ABC transporter permease [Thauera mechernichensis]